MSGEKKVEAELVPEGLTPEDMQIPERPAPVEGHVAKFASEFTAAMLAKGHESAEAEAPAEPEATGEVVEEAAKPEPAKTPEATQAEEEAAEAERWDKERQRKDQEAANERKELTKSVADLSAKLDQALQSKPAETKPAKPATPENLSIMKPEIGLPTTPETAMAETKRAVRVERSREGYQSVK